MTLAQLKESVARLGFSPPDEEMDGLIRDAALRALDEISAVRPRLVTASVWHLPSPPLYAEGSVEERVGEKTVSLPAGRSYLLRILGRGLLIFRQGGVERQRSFHAVEGGQPAVLGGNLPGEGGPLTVTVRAEGSYRLLTLAVYGVEFSSLPPDPFAHRAYDLSTLFPSFGGLMSPPRTKDGRMLREGDDGDYTFSEGHILSLSPHLAGEVRITYRARLTLPEQGEIPLREDEASLLPLFCAAYAYLEDDPDKAAFYLARFREGLRALYEPRGGVHPFCDVTGWG